VELEHADGLVLRESKRRVGLPVGLARSMIATIFGALLAVLSVYQPSKLRSWSGFAMAEAWSQAISQTATATFPHCNDDRRHSVYALGKVQCHQTLAEALATLPHMPAPAVYSLGTLSQTWKLS
jgi:hypothetical protein